MNNQIDTVHIQNVVASSAVDQALNLNNLGQDLPSAEYDPDSLSAIKYTTDEPKSTILIYRTGNIVVTGTKSPDDARDAIITTFDVLEELGIAVNRTADIDIQNIVTTANLGQPLNLNAIAIGLGLEYVEYEPEQFPGLVYRIPDNPVVSLLFGSGRIVITGAKEISQAEEGFSQIRDDLEELHLL